MHGTRASLNALSHTHPLPHCMQRQQSESQGGQAPVHNPDAWNPGLPPQAHSSRGRDGQSLMPHPISSNGSSGPISLNGMGPMQPPMRSPGGSQGGGGMQFSIRSPGRGQGSSPEPPRTLGNSNHFSGSGVGLLERSGVFENQLDESAGSAIGATIPALAAHVLGVQGSKHSLPLPLPSLSAPPPSTADACVQAVVWVPIRPSDVGDPPPLLSDHSPPHSPLNGSMRKRTVSTTVASPSKVAVSHNGAVVRSTAGRDNWPQEEADGSPAGGPRGGAVSGRGRGGGSGDIRLHRSIDHGNSGETREREGGSMSRGRHLALAGEGVLDPTCISQAALALEKQVGLKEQ